MNSTRKLFTVEIYDRHTKSHSTVKLEAVDKRQARMTALKEKWPGCRTKQSPCGNALHALGDLDGGLRMELGAANSAVELLPMGAAA